MAKIQPVRSANHPTDRALQMSDLDRVGQRVLTTNVKAAGNVKDKIGTRIESQQKTAVTAPSAGVRHNAANNARVLGAIEPHVRNKPITMAGATNRRVEAFTQGIDRSHAEGLSSGSGWYFEHRKGIAAAAGRHGIDVDRAITASAVMSPQNSPENERAATGALMHAETEGKVELTPYVHHTISRVGETQHQVGDVVKVSDLAPAQVAALSDTSRREGIQPHTNMGTYQVSRGGTKENIARAVGVLRGDTPAAEAIPPMSAPKIHSYRAATANATPGPVEHEYANRMDHVTKTITGERGHSAGQQRMDLTGLHSSTEGILNPKGGTAEDTWMNTLTFGQSERRVALPDAGSKDDRTVVGKHIASDKVLGLGLGKTASIGEANAKGGAKRSSMHPSPDVKGMSGLHAFNNQATINAADRVGRATGLTNAHGESLLPSVAMQEVAWTEVRRRTGKDPAYQGQVRDRSKDAARQPARPAPTLF